MVHPHVSQVNLKNDGSVDVVVEIVHIDTGHWADVSGYVIQEATAQGTELHPRTRLTRGATVSPAGFRPRFTQPSR